MRRMMPLLTAAAAALWALPATAQITADDVMSNTVAFYEAFGARQTASLNRSGDVVTVTGETINWQLPMGLGQLNAAMSDYLLTENADGSVTITYPASFSVAVSATIQGEGTASARIILGPDSYTTQATGTPGAVSYAATTGLIEATVTDIVDPMMEDIDINMTISIADSATMMRVVEDSLTVIFSQIDVGDTTTELSMASRPASDEFSMRSTASYGPTSSTVNMGLIPGGADILNLSTALRGGMYISAETSSTGSTSNSETLLFGRLSDAQDVVSGPSEGVFRFDSDGVLMSGHGRDLLFNVQIPDIFPFAIAGDLTEASATLQFPLLAGPQPQDFTFAFGLDGLRLGPGIWAQFDPGKELDRSPADLGIAVSGTAINNVDWLDILSLEGLMIQNELPMDIQSLNVSEMALSALGAMLTGQAALTFDGSDMTTYPGTPLPIGEASFEVQGLNGVIDTLSAIGVLPSEVPFAIRMSLGMVTVPGDGADVLTGRIEMTPDGQLIANGQRLR